ncbi:MAG: hypothetical protein ACRDJP_02315 [Actinomycetota bacterium]
MDIQIRWDPDSPEAAEANAAARELLTARRGLFSPKDPDAAIELWRQTLTAAVADIFDSYDGSEDAIEEIAERTAYLVSGFASVALAIALAGGKYMLDHEGGEDRDVMQYVDVLLRSAATFIERERQGSEGRRWPQI